MRQAYNAPQGLWLRLFTAVLAGWWLWVFLRPMQHLGLLSDVRSFLVVFIVLAAMQVATVRWIRAVGAFAVASYYMVRYFRPPHSSVLGGLWHLFATDVAQAYTLVMHGGSFGDPLQTQLFLYALCVIYWLLLYAAARPKLWIFYNALGVLVLGVVDANTRVHPNEALVVVLAVCTIVMGISHFQHLRPNLIAKGRPGTRFFAPLAVVICVSLGVSWVLPKLQPVWGNPLTALQGGSGTGKSAGAPEQVIGYQSDDASLGGSFVMNPTPVLSVVAPYAAYLQGQILNTYTGKGWVASSQNSEVEALGQSLLDSNATFSSNLPKKSAEQTVTVLSDGLTASALFGAYAVSKVDSIHGGKADRQVVVNPSTGTVSGSRLQLGETYTLTSVELEDPARILSAQPPLPSGFSPRNYPPTVQQDLQLPPTLPTRVRQLAMQLTSPNHTEYEKVLSVESYLQSYYTYATQGIPRPGQGQDYVDQFLFESRKGYCNNFSSAMAVLLRAADIPTRWVTGFTGGQIDASYQGTESRFVITDEDAHSWVQVYFPGLGWIPFDPTPNFNMPFAPSASPGVGSTQPPTVPPVVPKSPPPQSAASGASSVMNPLQALRIGAEVVGGLFVLLFALALLFRRRLLLLRYHSSWKHDTPDAMTRGMRRLLKLLRSRGLVDKTPGTTVRDIGRAARRLDVAEEDYRHLVRTAESTWYGPHLPPDEDLRRMRSTWRHMIVRVFQVFR